MPISSNPEPLGSPPASTGLDDFEPTQADGAFQFSQFATPQRNRPLTTYGSGNKLRPFRANGSATIEEQKRRVLGAVEDLDEVDATQGATQATQATQEASQATQPMNDTAEIEPFSRVIPKSPPKLSLIQENSFLERSTGSSLLGNSGGNGSVTKSAAQSRPSLRRKPEGSYYRPILGSSEVSMEEDEEVTNNSETQNTPNKQTSPSLRKTSPLPDLPSTSGPALSPLTQRIESPGTQFQPTQLIATPATQRIAQFATPATPIIASLSSQAVSQNDSCNRMSPSTQRVHFKGSTQDIGQSPLSGRYELASPYNGVPDTQPIHLQNTDTQQSPDYNPTQLIEFTPQTQRIDMFLTPKTFPQIAKMGKLDNSPVPDTQVIGESPFKTPKMPFIEEESPKNNDSQTSDFHLRFFRDAEDTQASSNAAMLPKLGSLSDHSQNNLQDSARSADLPNVTDFFEESNQDISSSGPGADHANEFNKLRQIAISNNQSGSQGVTLPTNQDVMSSQLSQIEVPATAEQKEDEIQEGESREVGLRLPVTQESEEQEKTSQVSTSSNEVYVPQSQSQPSQAYKSKSLYQPYTPPNAHLRRAPRFETFNVFGAGVDDDEEITSDYEDDKEKDDKPDAQDTVQYKSKRVKRRIVVEEEDDDKISKNTQVSTSSVSMKKQEINNLNNKRTIEESSSFSQQPVSKRTKIMSESTTEPSMDSTDTNISNVSTTSPDVANATQPSETSRKQSEIKEAAWPEWGKASKAGGRGVWIQWGSRMQVGCIFGGNEGSWTSLPSENLTDDDLLKRELKAAKVAASGQASVEVLFCDSTIGVTPMERIKILDLRLGDVLKINPNKKMQFEVVKLLKTDEMSADEIKQQVDAFTKPTSAGTVIEPDVNLIRVRDVNGYDYAIVKTHIVPPSTGRSGARRSSTRVSSTLTGSSQATVEEVYAVPFSEFYIPKSQWAVYLSRQMENTPAVDIEMADNRHSAVKSAIEELVKPTRSTNPTTPKKPTIVDPKDDKSAKIHRRKSTIVGEGAYYESSQEDAKYDNDYDRMSRLQGSTPAPNGEADTEPPTTPFISLRKKMSPVPEVGPLGQIYEGIFSGCIFSVTSSKGRAQGTQSITSNGGVVLKDGLDELFRMDGDTGPIHWRQSIAKGYKFAAVIATESMRTRKYLQALALGWPCLSWQYIQDCLSDPEVVNDWEHYLLSAGSSSVLGEVQMSLNLSQFTSGWNQGFTLEQQFEHRRKIFGCMKVPIYLVEQESLADSLTGKVTSSTSTGALKMRTSHALALSHTFRVILFLMGYDAKLVHLIRETSELDDLERLDVGESGVIVVHNCECSPVTTGGGSSKSSQRRSITNNGGSAASGRKKFGKLGCTEDRSLLRKLQRGEPVTGMIQYHREWIIQSLINGRVV